MEDGQKARKRHKPKEIVTKLRLAEGPTARGKSIAEAIWSIGVAEVAYCRWWNAYGGLKGD